MAYRFSGLSPVTQRVQALASRLAYVVLYDRTDRRRTHRVGRFDIDESNIVNYLESQSQGSALDLDDDEQEEEMTDSDYEALLHQAYELWEHSKALSPEIIAAGVTEWLKNATARHAYGDHHKRMRVKLMGNRGSRQLESLTFMYEDLSVPEESSLELAKERTSEEKNQDNLGNAYHRLGDAYGQWSKVVLDSSAHLHSISNGQILSLNRQLHDSRSQVDQLMAALLNAQIQDIENQREHATTSHEQDARHQLAHSALGQLGEVANVFMMTKGLPPSLRKLMGPLAENPALLQILGSPKAQALLRDPDSAQKLGELLNAIPMPGSETDEPIEGTYEEEV